MLQFITDENLKRHKEKYPAGTKVELLHMEDPYRQLPKGLKGVVSNVDDAGTVHVQWENGSSLGVAYGIDSIRKI
jgi:hypothetical protein